MNRTTPMTAEDDVRETPRKLFDALDNIHHFTLDACATHQNAKCFRYYTETGRYHFAADGGGAWGEIEQAQCNGLTGSWAGERVWCNPPFSDIRAWVEKAWLSDAELVYVLLPGTRCEQKWWQDMVEPYRDGRGSMPMILTTHFLFGRQHFTINGGQPILNPKTGTRSSPKFGLVGLLFTQRTES